MIKPREIGWVRNIMGLLLEISNDLLIEFSKVLPRIIAMSKGIGENSYFIIMYPSIPKSNISFTPNTLLVKTYDPTQHIKKTVGKIIPGEILKMVLDILMMTWATKKLTILHINMPINIA